MLAQNSTYALERKAAIDAVTRASKVSLKVLKALAQSETVVKEDRSPVTVADYSAQAVVNSIIATYFPSDQIVGEEDANHLRSEGKDLVQRIVSLVNSGLDSNRTQEEVLDDIDRGDSAGGSKGRFWTLDPIDGTKGFLRGGQYAVCLALVVDGQIQVGVLGCPNLPLVPGSDSERGVLFIAERGQGAYQVSLGDDSSEPQRISMTLLKEASQARFCESVEAGHSSHDNAEAIAKKLGITSPPVRMDSQCKYGSLARGDGNIYLRLPVSDTYQEKIWDHAAGCLIVEEAGGQISDIFGKPLDFSRGITLSSNRGVIAANKEIFPEVLAAVKSVLL